MENIEILGLIAATCTTSAFVPQVYKAWAQRSTRDISLIMYLVLVAGTLLWFVYGLYHQSLAIILANGITALLAALMIALKLKYD
jgi:MtN3 and saliva related transmembrane protein